MNKLQKQAQIDNCYAQIAAPSGPKTKAGAQAISGYTRYNGRVERRRAINEGRLVPAELSVSQLFQRGFWDAGVAKAQRMSFR